jgi:hypothetical protein
MNEFFKERRAALVIAHPGHELRVYAWLQLARPQVFVLTDGSGRSRKSRLHRTTQILNSLGARPGSIYGRLTDVRIYSAILNGERDLFIDLAHEVAEALAADRIDYVVADAIEGYNPVHDVCRLVTDAAVRRVREMGHCIENFDVLLACESGGAQPEAADGAITIQADDAIFQRKLQAAREYSEVEVDINRILAQEGAGSLRTEYLRPAKKDSLESALPELPYYEVHGEKQVAAGYYQKVIRYRQHLLPIARALEQIGERSKGLC